MIIVVNNDISNKAYENIKKYIEGKGARIHESEGIEKRILGVIGDKRDLDQFAIEALPGVEKVITILEPYKLASRKFHPKNSVIRIRDVVIGETEPIIMAGPCSVETEEQIWNIAEDVPSDGQKTIVVIVTWKGHSVTVSSVI